MYYPEILSFIVNEVLFWLGYYHLRNAISIALADVTIGACNTMKRERNGNQETNLDVGVQRLLARCMPFYGVMSYLLTVPVMGTGMCM